MAMPYEKVLHQKVFWLFTLFIGCCLGYDGTVEFKGRICTAEFLYLTQYQRYLVTWNGQRYVSSCSYFIHGHNDDNVVTTFRVCFKKLNSTFDTCHPFVRYIDGVMNEQAEVFNCTNPVPELWCSKINSYAQIEVNSFVNTYTELKIEVYATADVSLSVGAAVGISFGILAFLGILTLISFCILRKNFRTSNRGKVMRTQEVQQIKETENQDTVRYMVQEPS